MLQNFTHPVVFFGFIMFYTNEFLSLLHFLHWDIYTSYVFQVFYPSFFVRTRLPLCFYLPRVVRAFLIEEQKIVKQVLLEKQKKKKV